MTTTEQHVDPTTDQPSTDTTNPEPTTAEPTQTPPAQPEATAPTPSASPVRFEMVETERLFAHHANVREEIQTGAEFVRSIKASGVRVPLKVKEHPDGALEITMGGRRLKGAMEAGRTHVPCLIVQAGPLADDFLDMFIENVYREGFNTHEKAAALFNANDAGASLTKISRSLGLKSDVVKKGVAAGSLSTKTRKAVASYDWGFDELAALKPFDDDPDAIARIAMNAKRGTFDYAVSLEQQKRDQRAKHEALITKLTDAGVKVIDLAMPGMVALANLADRKGNQLRPETHATCPGHRALRLSPTDENAVRFVCADPKTSGHDPYINRADTSTAGATTSTATTQADTTADAAQALVRSGNRAWRAATEARMKFLRGYLGRKVLPRDAAEFTTRQMVTCANPIGKWMNKPRPALLADILNLPVGTELSAITAGLATANPNRLMVVQLAVIAAANERAMDEQTWRFDNAFGEVARHAAGQWLAFLRTIGYTPAPIEQAVIDQKRYTGDHDATAADDTEATAESTHASTEPVADETRTPSTPTDEAAPEPATTEPGTEPQTTPDDETATPPKRRNAATRARNGLRASAPDDNNAQAQAA